MEREACVCDHGYERSDLCAEIIIIIIILYNTINRHAWPKSLVPVAQRYHVTSDTLGREFDPGKRDFSH